MNTTFGETLRIGKIGESVIATWLRGRGWTVLPVYEKEEQEYKGPQLFTARAGELVAPDILTYRLSAGGMDIRWIEAKHKSGFSWHRRSNRWVTGIDLHHYAQYMQVYKDSTWPVWLLFLQRGGRTKDQPAELTQPRGLFGERIGTLAGTENHRDTRWGRHGMVYWALQSLRLLARLEDLGVNAFDGACRQGTSH